MIRVIARPRSRALFMSLVPLAACFLWLSLLVAPEARAEKVTVSVVNERGTPQAFAYVRDSYGWGVSDAYGRIDVESYPDDTNYVDRGHSISNISSSCPYSAPETEQGGVARSVPDPAPSQMQIVVPNTTGEPTAPGLTADERWLVGRLNVDRRANGAEPLYISTVLNRAADARASDYKRGLQFGTRCPYDTVESVLLQD